MTAVDKPKSGNVVVVNAMDFLRGVKSNQFAGPVSEGPLPKDRVKMLTQHASDHYDDLDDEVSEITLEDIGDILVELILPHFKGSIADGSAAYPQFRKSLTSDEVNKILVSLHHVLTQIKMRERKEVAAAKQRHPASITKDAIKSA